MLLDNDMVYYLESFNDISKWFHIVCVVRELHGACDINL